MGNLVFIFYITHLICIGSPWRTLDIRNYNRFCCCPNICHDSKGLLCSQYTCDYKPFSVHLLYNAPDSHSVPVKNSGHSQLKSIPLFSEHVPPLEHGLIGSQYISAIHFKMWRWCRTLSKITIRFKHGTFTNVIWIKKSGDLSLIELC